MPFSRLFGARLALRLLASFLLISLCGLIALLVWMSRPCPPPLEGIPFSACILDRDGRLLRVGLASDGRFRLRTSLEMLPGEAIDAVLHYEDRYFWYHPGVNLFSLVRAGLSMLAGGRTLGGSTLTMQVVRLKYNLRTGSLMDKLRQMALALRLEWHYDKKDILGTTTKRTFLRPTLPSLPTGAMWRALQRQRESTSTRTHESFPLRKSSPLCLSPKTLSADAHRRKIPIS